MAGWIVLVLGLVFAGAFGGDLLKYVIWRRRAERVPGRVTELHRRLGGSRGDRPQMRYSPILEFTTRDGRDIRTRLNVGTKPAPAKTGEQVTVVYDPRSPEHADIAGKGWLRLSLLILGTLLGVSLVGVFVATLFV